MTDKKTKALFAANVAAAKSKGLGIKGAIAAAIDKRQAASDNKSKKASK
jgi:hypothetical protein